MLSMIKLSVLFAVKTFPTENDDYYDDANPNIAGLAEWFLTIPDLFLLLLGKDAQTAPFAVYNEAGTNKALVTETQKAQQRWQLYFALAKTHAPDLISTLAPIDAMLQAVKYPFIALDIFSAVSEKDQAAKKYKLFVESLQKRAGDLAQALAQSDSKNCHAAIRDMFGMPQKAHGYWSAEVLMRSGVIERDDIANIPCLVGYEEYEDGNPSWLYHIPAYIVRKKGSGERTPIGVVTPYGRWLVPLELGMTSVDDLFDEQQMSCHGWIKCDAVEYDKKHNCTRNDSVLFDINGNQETPVLQNSALCLHSEKVASLYSNFIEKNDQADIVSLPDLHVILADIAGVDYSNDGFIHYRKSQSIFYDNEQQERDFTGLLNQDGSIIVLADKYASIGEMHKTKQIAAVTTYRPDYIYNCSASATIEENIGFLKGVINAQGQQIVPCEYAYLLPINGENRIKVHQKDRLLVMGLDKKLSIFKTNGELVAVTQYQVPGQLIYLGGYLHDDWITVTDGENVMPMDFDGLVGAPEMTLADFMDAVLAPYRDMLGRVKQNRENPTAYKTVSAQEIIESQPWDVLFELCTYLCLDDENAVVQMCKAITEHVQSADYDEADWSIPTQQSVHSVVFNIAFRDAADSGFGARIDWKDSETLGALATIAPKIAALKGFKWSAEDNADSMTDGIAAAAKYVRKSKANLFTLPADGDLYEIGFVSDANMQLLMQLTNSVGIALNFDW
jgi:hypothetical protein